MRAQQTFLHSENGVFHHYYLCKYLSLQGSTDLISRSLLRFKQGLQPHLDYWIDAAVNTLRPLSPLSSTVIIRALAHQETIADPNAAPSLDRLARSLSGCLNLPYISTILSKTIQTPPNKRHSRDERMQHLNAAYLAAATPHSNFLLIDDILTTGATAKAIISALRHSNPSCQITLFTLAKASRN